VSERKFDIIFKSPAGTAIQSLVNLRHARLRFEGPRLLSAEPIHRAHRDLEIVAFRILRIAQCQKHIVMGRPDPAQVEMTSGDDARLLDAQEIIDAFSQNCRQALDPFFLLVVVSKTPEIVPRAKHFLRRRLASFRQNGYKPGCDLATQFTFQHLVEPDPGIAGNLKRTINYFN
jgi:hypothetical protein